MCEAYHNKRNDITFNHDFPYGKPLAESYDKVKEKYDRRIARQMEQIKESKNILAVYLQIPNNRMIVNDDTLIKAHDILKEKYPQKSITLFYLYCDHEKEEAAYKELQKGLIRTDYNYDGYDKKFPYVVDRKRLQKVFCKLKITGKFASPQNLCNRYIYLTKCFFRGML